MTELLLEGCTPEPLMSYLKALGVLRLVSEQVEAEARGQWRDGTFVLESTLDREGLTRFFLERYSPTPLLAPWNGGSGFYVKLDLDRLLDSGGSSVEFKGREAVGAIDAIEASETDRLARYRGSIRETRRALASLGARVDFGDVLAGPIRQWQGAAATVARRRIKDEATKVLAAMLLFRSGSATFSIGKAAKDQFVSDLRGKVLPDDGLSWLDASLAMRTGQKKNRTEAPTLGSGGNIGNSEFSVRFAQLISVVMPLRSDAPIPENSAEWLEASMFGTPAPRLRGISVDQFDPGKAGGANGTQGLESVPMLNPWDYLLMMEGAIALAGNTSRRIGSGRTSASFPFVVASTSAGHGSVGSDGTRGETWLPLWSAPATFAEISTLLSEGRAEVGRVRARTGLTFAQAVAGLGVDRGIDSFVRYEFQERLGQSYIATPLGRFEVPNAARGGIELVRALNEWLDSLRFACRTKKEGAKTDPPPRFPSAMRRIDAAVFDFCKYGGEERLSAILQSLGRAERELAAGGCGPDQRRTRRPLSGLPTAWSAVADDGSPEFRLARGVAFLAPGTKGTGSVRRFLEPVEANGKSWEWAEGGGHVVWSGGNVARNLGAVLVRRLLEAEKKGEPSLPLGSPCPASLDDVAAFLDGDVDDSNLEDLLWGLSLVEAGRIPDRANRQLADGRHLPRAYALCKLALTPGRLEWADGPRGEAVLRVASRDGDRASRGVAVTPDPAIVANLRAGNVRGACDVAARRLQAAGFSVVGSLRADGVRRDVDWSAAGVSPERLLASLLFPIPDRAVNRLADLVLRRPSAESRS